MNGKSGVWCAVAIIGLAAACADDTDQTEPWPPDSCGVPAEAAESSPGAWGALPGCFEGFSGVVEFESMDDVSAVTECDLESRLRDVGIELAEVDFATEKVVALTHFTFGNHHTGVAIEEATVWTAGTDVFLGMRVHELGTHCEVGVGFTATSVVAAVVDLDARVHECLDVVQDCAPYDPDAR